MIKIQMDCCVQIKNTAINISDKIRIICPFCLHETTYDFNKGENRCSECSIIINEEDIYQRKEVN